jgi:hypothetical protein
MLSANAVQCTYKVCTITLDRYRYLGITHPCCALPSLVGYYLLLLVVRCKVFRDFNSRLMIQTFCLSSADRCWKVGLPAEQQWDPSPLRQGGDQATR